MKEFVLVVVESIFIEDQIVLEIKAVTALDNSHLAQILNYLEVYDLPFVLLMNFGSKSLISKRIYNTKHIDNLYYKT